MHFVSRAPGRLPSRPSPTEPVLLDSHPESSCAPPRRPAAAIGSAAYFAAPLLDSSARPHSTSPPNSILTPPLTSASASVTSSAPSSNSTSPQFPSSMATRLGDTPHDQVKPDSAFHSPAATHASSAAAAHAAGAALPQASSGNASSSSTASQPRKRASRAGTRSVATLSAAQLDRKRANDREAQRAIRQRTKEHIERLEKKVADLTQGGDWSEQLDQARERIRYLENENRVLKSRLPDGHFMGNMHEGAHSWEDMSSMRPPPIGNGNIGMISQPGMSSSLSSAARHDSSGFSSQMAPHWQSGGASFSSPAVRRSGPSPMMPAGQDSAWKLPGQANTRDDMSPSVHHGASGLPQTSMGQPMDYSPYIMSGTHQRAPGSGQYATAVPDHTAPNSQPSHQLGGIGLHSSSSYGQQPPQDQTPRFMPHQPPSSTPTPHQSSQPQSQGQPGFSSQAPQSVFYGQPRYQQQ